MRPVLVSSNFCEAASAHGCSSVRAPSNSDAFWMDMHFVWSHPDLISATTDPADRSSCCEGVTNSGLTTPGESVEQAAATCRVRKNPANTTARLADERRPLMSCINNVLQRCNGGSTSNGSRTQRVSVSLVALRHQLSPVLPLSRCPPGALRSCRQLSETGGNSRDRSRPRQSTWALG